MSRDVEFEFEGKQVFFHVRDSVDLIQREQSKGRFYEQEELEIMRRHFSGGAFVDIGANVGNHTIFAICILGAQSAVVFEANSVTVEILKENLRLNQIEAAVNTAFLGRVVTADEGASYTILWKRENMGAARPRLDQCGTVKGISADTALADRKVSYIKIDVEGGELSVLASLRRTIERCRPRIFVEVDQKNELEFFAWLKANNYEIFDRYKRYQVNENYFISPIS
ncbi:MAG: FkbM family methyltransferase [Roseicyclus sp.]|uniref:FkbM family methyltransferase n=1 Tax=Roseicyclus sp. TaxID=1914329 RepID=UPI003A8B1E98